jgi:Ca2+-binding RTX toxin-like protein
MALAFAAPAQAVLEEPDLCGDASVGESTHDLAGGIGDGTPGKAFLCGQPWNDLPPFQEWAPQQGAPDPIDPSGEFDRNRAYIIGPNGQAANWSGISTNSIIASAIEGFGSGLVVAAFTAAAFPPASWVAAVGVEVATVTVSVLRDVGTQLYTAYEDMSASDWDFYVPGDSGSGDWRGWVIWDGLGEVQTVTIDPHLVNQYYYNMQDYADKAPMAYIRLYVGVSQRPVNQGDGIVDDAWTANSNGQSAFSSGAGDRGSVRRGRAGVARVDLRPGNQRLTGTAANDELSARVGNNALLGAGGHDQLGGGPGADVLRGGPGSDELRAFGGDDQLRGGPGSDVLLGHSGADALAGGPGDDVLSDGPGRRSGGRTLLLGGPGRDFVIARDGDGDDELHCGPGRDVAVADRFDTIAGDCERVMLRPPPRGTNPPAMGHAVGRPPGSAQPEWGFSTLLRAHRVRSSPGRGSAPLHSPRLERRVRQAGRG